MNSKSIALLETALKLPNPSPGDFVKSKPPADSAAQRNLRIVVDAQLRQRLVTSRLAEVVQARRGRENVLPIVLLYPDGDAPARQPPVERRKALATEMPMPSDRRSLPTVEAMSRLLERIQEVEVGVSRETLERLAERIDAIKARIAAADGDELQSAYEQLGHALDERRAFANHSRAEAFRRIELDSSFVERVYLWTLARP